jgi:branched-chain amino acid transport system substrate-binding protein
MRRQPDPRQHHEAGAASIKGLQQGGLLPGIQINTSATDFSPIKQLRLMKFTGDHWELFGDVMTGEIGGG